MTGDWSLTAWRFFGREVPLVAAQAPASPTVYRQPVAQNEVKHSTDTIVARNKKTFTMDAILVTEEEQEDKNPKKEPKETAED